MTVLSRGARSRRGGRRPGWLLLTALLVLAIAASSALVFTDRVELLKFAVILALWAAVVAAFVSVIYRRQSDADAARARDLKLVYDLQLDREISARREYELTVESHLRRELASELRAQAADEVAALRAELAALRNNLEILFETELTHRPAIETERTTVRAYSNWERDTEVTDPGRNSARFRQEVDLDTGENRIIDVPEEPLGRRNSMEEAEPEPEPRGHRHAMDDGATVDAHPRVSENGSWTAPPASEPVAESAGRHGARRERTLSGDSEWEPAPAEGQWLPAGTPGSNWAAATNGGSADHPAAAPTSESYPEPATVDPEPLRGHHAGGAEGQEPGEVAPEPGAQEPAEEAAQEPGEEAADLPAAEAPTREPGETPPETPAAEAPTEEPAAEAPTREPDETPPETPAAEAPTEEPAAEAPTEEPAAEEPAEEAGETPPETPAAEAPTEEPAEEAGETPPETPAAEAPTEEPAAEAPTEEPAAEEPDAAQRPSARHRVAAGSPTGNSQHGEGQGESVAELLARLQTTSIGVGRRRRRDD